MMSNLPIRKKIAVVGTGISGMSAAWLIYQRHDVTVYERAGRVGGHSNTVTVPGANGDIPVDTGFIVYNETTYPNLTALLRHFNVPTQPSEMSFAVSLGDGDFEYSGTSLAGLLAQKRNLVRPRFWSMLNDLRRFYRDAPRDLDALDAAGTTLGDYLDAGRYGTPFRHDHLLPMAGAIWSAPSDAMLAFPASSFIRFFVNHGLLKLRDRPQWRSVVGGSRAYVARLTQAYRHRIRLASGVASIHRGEGMVRIRDGSGRVETFDDVVIAVHADEALAMLDAPSAAERDLLGAFRYSRNAAVLHSDAAFMPRRRVAWSSWNHTGDNQSGPPTVTYWMNALQGIGDDTPLFVTLNPRHAPREVLHQETYDHPLLDSAAIAAQQRLWSLQGQRNTWFCGAYFGAGFHEDGLQAGLAVAEALGGVRRPWTMPAESGRIVLDPADSGTAGKVAA